MKVVPSVNPPSRRGLLAAAGMTAATAWLAPRSLLPAAGNAGDSGGNSDRGIVDAIRHSAGTEPINIQQLRAGISVISGSGGNIAVFTGPDGKLLVDAGIPASKGKITAALATLGSGAIRYLINTHWHFDHTDGNDWLHAEGATIIAHENTRARLSKPTRVAGWRFTFPARPASALPAIEFKSQMAMHFNGSPVRMEYYAPAHTDTDVSVYFPDADVLHVGDTWWNGYYPFIDYSTGGTIDGTIEAAEINLTKVSDKTLVIPGHGPVGSKSGLVEFRDLLVEIRARVSSIKKQGKSLAEAIAQKPTASFDARWGGFAIDGPAFTELVYAGV